MVEKLNRVVHRAPAGAAARSRAAAGGDRLRALDVGRRGARDPAHGATAGEPGEADRRGGVELGDFVQDGRRLAPSTRRRCRCAGRTSERALDRCRAGAQGDRLRFGRGRQPYRWRSARLRVTRERIHQIENNTLKKLEGLPGAGPSQRRGVSGLASRRPPARDVGVAYEEDAADERSDAAKTMTATATCGAITR